jgi:hypothetical protein
MKGSIHTYTPFLISSPTLVRSKDFDGHAFLGCDDCQIKSSGRNAQNVTFSLRQRLTHSAFYAQRVDDYKHHAGHGSSLLSAGEWTKAAAEDKRTMRPDPSALSASTLFTRLLCERSTGSALESKTGCYTDDCRPCDDGYPRA